MSTTVVTKGGMEVTYPQTFNGDTTLADNHNKKNVGRTYQEGDLTPEIKRSVGSVLDASEVFSKGAATAGVFVGAEALKATPCGAPVAPFIDASAVALGVLAQKSVADTCKAVKTGSDALIDHCCAPNASKKC